jgi:hypothetical protein
MAQTPGEGTAITTLWVEASMPGSKLHIRRVYYGATSFPSLAHSRGDYERDFLQKIQKFLAKK